MSLLTTTSLIVVWCTLEVVVSQSFIPQPPVPQQYAAPQDPNSYPVNAGYQMNVTYPGSQEGQKPYQVIYMEKDQVRCETCDPNGKVSGNVTYLDGKANRIRTVKYETSDIPLDPNSEVEASRQDYSRQEAYQQQVQQPQQQLLQPYRQVAQGQMFQNQAVMGPVGSVPMAQLTQQIQPAFIPNQPSPTMLDAVRPPMDFANVPYAASPSYQPVEKNVAQATSSFPINAFVAEAVRNLQAASVPAQPLMPQTQFAQSQVNDGLGNDARRINFLNGNGVDDKPDGPILSSLPYQYSSQVYNSFPNKAYSFAYNTPEASRQESADPKNNVVGSYSYADPTGRLHKIDYSSGTQGFQSREQTLPTTPVMPAMILMPTQQPSLGQQIPFTLVAAGAPTAPEATDKTKDEDKSSEVVDMLQRLADEIVNKMDKDKPDSSDSPQPTAEGAQTTEDR